MNPAGTIFGALNLDVHPAYTGKGVTICFIDSGFYTHPDLTTYRNRIKVIADITCPERTPDYFTHPHPESWHGTMTSVVCAGNGYMSDGLYKGIASDADLVLLKVQDETGKITTENMVGALLWVLQHHHRYNIRIVNISVFDDELVSWKESRVDAIAEQLVEQGVVLVAAVGNDVHGVIRPPANSPHVIAVGGTDDDYKMGVAAAGIYHSSYGKTIDGLIKPDLVAPATRIAAPVLPDTPEHDTAKALFASFDHNDVPFIGKYISPHYMQVDGTSFAATLVSAVTAQLLEANPQLTPHVIREILFTNARRISGVPAEQQGFGLIQPRRSVVQALKRGSILQPTVSPAVNKEKGSVEFYVYRDGAAQVSLAGSFTDWVPDIYPMEREKHGRWKIAIPLLPDGKYPYKFFVDHTSWMEDVLNPYREPDGFCGFNSLLMIEPD
jgi:serine protease AprX